MLRSVMTQQPLALAGLVDLRTPTVHCVLDAEYQSSLVPLLEDADPTEWSGFAEVKESTVRTILRGSVADGLGNTVALHLKLFRAARLADHAPGLVYPLRRRAGTVDRA